MNHKRKKKNTHQATDIQGEQEKQEENKFLQRIYTDLPLLSTVDAETNLKRSFREDAQAG